MTITHQQAERIARDAAMALRRGEASAAHLSLAPLKAGGAGFVPPWFLIAQAAEAAGDEAAAAAALVALFDREPRHLHGLLVMAALKVRLGDDRAAQSFYRMALTVASQPGATVPASLTPLLRRGETFIADVTQRFTDHLEAAVAGRSSGRLRYATDLLLGRSELFLQHPSMFYFPGLPQRAFFERHEFPWLAAIEASTAAMRKELLALMADEAGFAPYVQAAPDRPAPDNPLLNDPSWAASYLWRDGIPDAVNSGRCPAAMAALAHAPLPIIAGRSPMALFSRLQPGAHIRPHHGLLNTRLIVHVPLIAPQGCALRVGAETRSWKEGEALIFDDSIEHEAWNRSRSTRVVLLFEVWRPELTDEERLALTAIFEAIDGYQGVAQDNG